MTRNFTGKLYRSGYTKQGETLFRAGDSKGFRYGGYWSHDRPVDELTIRHSKAVPYHWPGDNGEPLPRNTLDIGLEGRWEAGAAKYTGLVAPQKDAKTGELFEGGGGQVHIPRLYGHPERKEWRINQKKLVEISEPWNLE